MNRRLTTIDRHLVSLAMRRWDAIGHPAIWSEIADQYGAAHSLFGLDMTRTDAVVDAARNRILDRRNGILQPEPVPSGDPDAGYRFDLYQDRWAPHRIFAVMRGNVDGAIRGIVEHLTYQACQSAVALTDLDYWTPDLDARRPNIETRIASARRIRTQYS